MQKRMEISNRSSNRKGKSVSIYLRAEDLETLDILSKAFDNDRSKTVQFMLTTVKGWMEALIEKKPEFITALIQNEMHKLIANQKKTMQI